MFDRVLNTPLALCSLSEAEAIWEHVKHLYGAYDENIND